MADGFDRILALKIAVDTGEIAGAQGKTRRGFKDMARSASSWGKALTAGLVIGGIEKVSEALFDAWDGFRAGERVAAQLGVTWRNLGKDAGDLDQWMDRLSTSTLKLGTDGDEAVAFFNTSIKRTRSAAKSYREYQIAQDLVANGSAPNLAAAERIIQQAAKGADRVVDKFGLTSRTAAGRVAELGRKVKGAAKEKAKLDPLGVLFNSIGESLETIVGSLATGNIDGALQGLADVGTALSTAWDGVGPKITETLDGLTGGKFSEGVALIQGLADDILPKVQGALAATGPFIAAVAGAFNNLITFIQPVIDILVGLGTASVKVALDTITGVMETITLLLNGDFSGAWTAIQTTIGTVIDDIVAGINSIVPTLTGIIEGVATEAGKIGKAIADGIVDLAKGIPDRLVGFIRDGLNSIIRIWNDFAVNIPEIVLFEGFGRRDTFGPISLALPDIPQLATGGIVRARPGGVIARLGEAGGDEAVVPLGRHGEAGLGTTIVNVTVNAPVAADGYRAASEIAHYLDLFFSRGGRLRYRPVGGNT